MAIKALLQQGLKLSLPKYDHPSGKVNSGLAARPTRRISPRYLRMCREMKMCLIKLHPRTTIRMCCGMKVGLLKLHWGTIQEPQANAHTSKETLTHSPLRSNQRSNQPVHGSPAWELQGRPLYPRCLSLHLHLRASETVSPDEAWNFPRYNRMCREKTYVHLFVRRVRCAGFP